MIQSEILKEKDKIQAKLSEESESIHDYLAQSCLAAKEVAELYGFPLQYAEMPNITFNRSLMTLFDSCCVIKSA